MNPASINLGGINASEKKLVIKLSTLIIYQIQILASIDILLTFGKVSLTISNPLLTNNNICELLFY